MAAVIHQLKVHHIQGPWGILGEKNPKKQNKQIKKQTKTNNKSKM